jgi:hypothetical protein
MVAIVLHTQHDIRRRAYLFLHKANRPDFVEPKFPARSGNAKRGCY